MRSTRWVAIWAIIVVCGVTFRQQPASSTPNGTAIRAPRLIDGKSDSSIANALILVEGDKIVSVTPGGAAPASRL